MHMQWWVNGIPRQTSTTWGSSTMVDISPVCAPASVPWAQTWEASVAAVRVHFRQEQSKARERADRGSAARNQRTIATNTLQ